MGLCACVSVCGPANIDVLLAEVASQPTSRLKDRPMKNIAMDRAEVAEVALNHAKAAGRTKPSAAAPSTQAGKKARRNAVRKVSWSHRPSATADAARVAGC